MSPARLFRSSKLVVAEADLVKFRHLDQPVDDGQGQVALSMAKEMKGSTSSGCSERIPAVG